MILAYVEADKLLCAVWIGTKPADSALNGALFAICSVTATMNFTQVNMYRILHPSECNIQYTCTMPSGLRPSGSGVIWYLFHTEAILRMCCSAVQKPYCARAVVQV